MVLLTAIASAVLGDNMAYWIGRRYGRLALTRFLKIGPERIERMQGLVLRYGMLAVFVGRFVAGLRFMAGPLAGITGLSPLRFFIANLLGAIIYVPFAIGVGYAVGYGLGGDDPVNKAKFISFTAEGLERAKALLEEMFARKDT